MLKTTAHQTNQVQLRSYQKTEESNCKEFEKRGREDRSGAYLQIRETRFCEEGSAKIALQRSQWKK